MSEISSGSGLVAVAWSYVSPLGTVRKLQDRKPCLNKPEEHNWTPLVRLSDAEAIIAEKDAEIERIKELEQTLFSRDVDLDAKGLIISEQDAEINRLTEYQAWLNDHCSNGWDKVDEQAAEIYRLRAVIAKCKAGLEELQDMNLSELDQDNRFFVLRSTLAAIKEEGL